LIDLPETEVKTLQNAQLGIRRASSWPAVAALCALSFGVAHADEVSLYVAPNGNDAWSGRLPEAKAADGPFVTLARAQTEVRKLKAAGQLADGVTVFVRGGSYELHEILTLGPEDSGVAAAPVVYRAYPGEKPVLGGARKVTGFKPWKGDVLQCSLKGTALEGTVFKQLFFRGERMVMARYPNVDPKDPHFGTWAHVAAVDGEAVKDHFTCTDDVVKDWTRIQRAEVCIHPAYGWAWNIVPVKEANRDERRISLARNVSYNLRVGDRYFVRNLLEELDAPGEWYLDPDSWTLYFWPPTLVGQVANLSSAEVEAWAPVVGTLVAMNGASHVTVRGFTVEACDGDAVQIDDCESCVVAQSVIRNCGGWGVSIRAGHKSGAVGNDLYATGAGGVSLNGGDPKTLARGDNFVTNNYIHHIAEFRRTYNTGVNVTGVGNVASHNLIHDCYHQGILMGGNDNVVEYNVVHHTNLGSEDTGGLYMSSRNYLVRGNVIRHNVFHHVGGFGKANSWTPVQNGRVKFEYPHFTWGIYLDAPEVGVTVFGNVLYSVPVCGLFNHEGRDNTWENNIVIDAPGFRASSGNYPDLAEQSYSYLKRAQADGTFPLYLQHYPELAKYLDHPPAYSTLAGSKFVRNILYYTPDGGKMIRDRNPSWGGQLVWTYSGRKDDFPLFQFDNNCVYGPPDLPLKFSLTASPDPAKLLSWNEWRQTGQDAHSLLADPLFVDPANHDYRLKPESPALKLGFKQIPFEKIGPYQDELRASWPVVEAPGASALGDFTTERYFQLPGYEPVKAQEFVPRGGIPHFAGKLAAKKPLTVACFAGGNHAQGGWFAAFMDDLRKRHPEAESRSVLADIHGGARGSGFSLYRFRNEVLQHKPDLTFVDFASDDTETGAESIWPTVEGIVRQAWRADATTDLVFVYAFKAGMETDYAKGLCPEAVSAYERLADHYGIPSINLGCRVAALARDGKLLLQATPDEAKQPGAPPVFSTDGVYTSAAAKELYAGAIADGVAELAAGATGTPAPERSRALAKPFRANNLERARQLPLTPAMLTGKWERRDPGEFAKHFDALWFTNTPGAKLTFRFKGTAASLFDAMGPDTGRVKLTVDGQDKGIRQQVDPWCYYQRLSALPIASGLDDKEHLVTVELLPDPPDRSVPIAEAKKANQYNAKDFEGVALRIGWIRVIGEAAE